MVGRDNYLMTKRICQTCNAYETKQYLDHVGFCYRSNAMKVPYNYHCRLWGLDEAYSRCPKPVEKINATT